MLKQPRENSLSGEYKQKKKGDKYLWAKQLERSRVRMKEDGAKRQLFSHHKKPLEGKSPSDPNGIEAA